MALPQASMMLDLLAFANAVPQGFLVIDMQSKITCCNRGFCDLFGFDEVEDAIGYDLNDLIADGQPHPHHEDMTPLIKAGRSTAIDTAGVVKGITVQGAEISVYVWNRVLFRRGEIARGAAFVEAAK